MDERNNNTNILSKIRCKYIIIKIFDNIKKRKLLNVINYNKKYQKLMKIKLNDYKKQFSKIEIEIIAKDNINGDFIKKNIKINQTFIFIIIIIKEKQYLNEIIHLIKKEKLKLL